MTNGPLLCPKGQRREGFCEYDSNVTGVFAPVGATECSHQWSVAQPVESVGSNQHRPGRSEGTVEREFRLSLPGQ